MTPPRLRALLWVLVALAAGLALRLCFIHYFPQTEGDTQIYADIARNWLNHGVYGRSVVAPGAEGVDVPSSQVAPTLVRLPGYPAFLALCFTAFGQQNFTAVMYVQVVIDLATCLLIAAFVRRLCGQRAASIALWLAALCPFTANYVAMPLAETPSIFCVALGYYAFVRLVDQPRWKWILALAFAWSYAALLRPDGALLAVVLFPAIIFYGCSQQPAATQWKRALPMALACAALSLLPFLGWTVRNWHTFHVLQPLAPRSATDPGEPTATGFQRWTKTWLVDFASTYEIYWNVPGDSIDVALLPARALDAYRSETLDVIAQYNAQNRLTPAIDDHFATLAQERIKAEPFRFYVALPLLRLADMWLRPRVEMLNFELRWWQYHLHYAETRMAYAYGALNLFYLLAGLIGLCFWPRFGTAMVAFLVVRSMLLLTLEAPEPRYTLECFPIVISLAALALERGTRRWQQNSAGRSVA